MLLRKRQNAFTLILLLTLLALALAACAGAEQQVQAPAQAAATQEGIAASSTGTPEATDTLTTAVPSPTATASATATSEPLPTETVPPSLTPTFPPATATVAATETATIAPPPATATATVAPTTVLTPTVAAAAPGAVTVNGLPVDAFVIMPPEVRENVRAIYRQGQQQGRNPNVFSKVGDSVTLTDHYLTRFDSGYYTLGDAYAYLQPTIDHYSGSFARYGVATRVGLHAWSLFDPLWANKEWCQPNEDMVACEIRLNNPSVLLIRMGSNDSGAASVFEENMRSLVQVAIDNGIVPILATKADRFEGPDNRNNKILRQIAADYKIPLWDYDVVAGTIPRRGLGGDDVHMTMADANDYTNPETFNRGYPVNDLTALMVLHAVLQEVQSAGDA